MSQQNRTTLKSYFETGDAPTEAQFINFIDSILNLTDDTLDSIAAGTTNKHFTDTEKTKLVGIEAGANVTDAGNVGSSIAGATAKATIVDGDRFGLLDSEASNVLKTSLWSLIKSTLKTYFDGLYNNYVHPNHSGDVTSVGDSAQTIANSAVTLAKMANLAQNYIIGRISAGAGVPEALTAANIRSIINVADGSQANASGGTLTGELDLGENAGIVLDASLSADGKYSGITEPGTAGVALVFGNLCYCNSSGKWVLAKADVAATSGGVKLGICVLAASGDAQTTKVLLFGKVNAASLFPTFTVNGPVYISAATAGTVVTTQPSATDNVIRYLGYGNTADELFFCPDQIYFEHT